MSKIGKKPVIIPDNVEVKENDGFLNIKGQGGELSLKILPYIKTEIKEKEISFAPLNNSKQARANWGTIRSLTENAVLGVSKGFQKSLEIEGVGFRANLEGDTLILNIGLSHPIKFNSPEGIKISIVKNVITVSGISKELVGKTAAKIRSMKKPEPYKGKGIRYQGEIIRRKAGKKAAGTAGATAK